MSDQAFEQLQRAAGKTIARVRYAEDHSTEPSVHRSEYLVFEFSDGR
jgi:hypothetical protein